MHAARPRMLMGLVAFLACVVFALGGMTAPAAAQWNVRSITSNEYEDVTPDMDEGVVVWRAEKATQNDISLYDLANPGAGIVSVTDDLDDDSAPVINHDSVLYVTVKGAERDIYSYSYSSGSSPSSSLLSERGWDDSDPALSWGTAAWVGHDGTNAEIFFRDLASIAASNISQDPTVDDLRPAVDGGTVAWQTGEVGATTGNEEVYAWQASTATKQHLSTTSTANSPPDVTDDQVVWLGTDSVGAEGPSVYLFELNATSPSPEIINMTNVGLTGPRIDDGIAVWGNDSGGELDIVAYSTLTGLEREIGVSGVDEFSARIDGRFVAWDGFDNADSAWNVYVHDLMTGETTALTDSSLQDTGSGTSDGHVFWESDDGNDREIDVATFIGSASPFSDVAEDQAFLDAIRFLSRHDVVSGYSDGRYGLFDPVLRAQMAKITSLAHGIHDFFLPAFSSFDDVASVPGDAYYPIDYVEEAAAAGFVEGYADGSFRPWNDLTRIALVRILVRAAGADLANPPADYDTGFIDVPTADEDVVDKAHFNGLIQGTSGTTFGPYETATRGHVAQVLYNALQAAGES